MESFPLVIKNSNRTNNSNNTKDILDLYHIIIILNFYLSMFFQDP